MSILAITERKILLNITNMEDRGVDITNEMTPSGVNEVREVKGVKAADPTPPAVSPMVLNSTIVAQSAGQSLHCSRRPGTAATRKDCPRSTHGCSGKFGRSVGGNAEKKSQKEECLDPAAKKRKTRRGKPKHRKLKPYPKQTMSYEQRLHCRAIGRMTKTGAHPPAPYNTTQFLMEDHSDLPDLDQKLADALTSDTMPASFQKPIAPPRTRDSSFSIDSDEDYFYSSPENEEEFLTKEFSSAYEDLHAERLSTLTKSELIQEYVQLEAKFDMLTKRLKSKNLQQAVEDKETESKNGTSSGASCDNDLAKKLKTCQQRLDDLMQQNEQLRRDNEALRAKNCRSPVSSVDSESDSESSSAQSSCTCSAGSGRSSTNNGKSYQNRREQEHRRNKRRSSVDSDSDSSSTTSSENDSSMQPQENSRGSNDLVNGNTTSHEISGLPP